MKSSEEKRKLFLEKTYQCFRLQPIYTRKEIKADVRKQEDLYMNNLFGDVKVKYRLLSVHQ